MQQIRALGARAAAERQQGHSEIPGARNHTSLDSSRVQRAVDGAFSSFPSLAFSRLRAWNLWYLGV